MNDFSLYARMRIPVICRECRSLTVVKVINRDLILWQGGGLPVQLCFPYISAARRELLVSRTCGACWNAMFSPEPTVKTRRRFWLFGSRR